MVRYTAVSSANRPTWDCTLSGRSLMYSRNKTGPRTELCGTPEDIGTRLNTHLQEEHSGFYQPRKTGSNGVSYLVCRASAVCIGASDSFIFTARNHPAHNPREGVLQ